MLYNLRDKFNRFRFAQACSGILGTKPARLDSKSNTIVFSQLQHKDVLLALLAFKSFASRVSVGEFRLLNDGSLTGADIELLTFHLPGLEILELDPVRSAACPKGGCWERLLWIARLSRDRYVVQLDSDTLTLDDVPEVAACILENRSFVIGTWDNQDFETMVERANDAKKVLATQQKAPHIQVLAEANFDKLGNYEALRYVRGCAGFSGFSAGSVSLEFIETISQQMRVAIGSAWDQWGSEQVMSNVVVARDPNAHVLPHPKYCDCSKLKSGHAAFVHFIGSCRFTGETYQSLSRQVISTLTPH